MQTTNIQNAIDTVEMLQLEEQEIFLELFNKRLQERRRDEIARNAKETLEAIKNGKAKIGSFSDLMQNIIESK
ncbi:MAG: hypothetical protein HW421_3858 [Ignavibacteria bacterium]|nr:hypothetical protein [Ignavibacteria bacterium]